MAEVPIVPSSASLRSFIEMGTSRSFRLPTVIAIDGQNPTGAHLEDAVCENGSILPIVRDVYDRQIQRALEPREFGSHVCPQLGVKAREGLVQPQHTRSPTTLARARRVAAPHLKR